VEVHRRESDESADARPRRSYSRWRRVAINLPAGPATRHQTANGPDIASWCTPYAELGPSFHRSGSNPLSSSTITWLTRRTDSVDRERGHSQGIAGAADRSRVHSDGPL